MLIILFCYILLLLVILLAIFWLTNLWVYRKFAPWVPIKRRDIERIFALAELKPNQVFYDLGCGTGWMVISASREFGAKAIGLEINLILFWICKIRQIFYGGKNLVFKFRDLYKEELSSADVVYFYGIPTKNGLVSKKLRQELKPGAKIISYTFSLPGWTPVLVDQPTLHDKPIFIYRA